MSTAVGSPHAVGSFGWRRESAAATAPGEVDLAVVNDGDGSVTATVSGGSSGIDYTLYYRRPGVDDDWTAGSRRTGDGDISQTGLDTETEYAFVIVPDDGGTLGTPSNVIRLYVSSGTDYLWLSNGRQALLSRLQSDGYLSPRVRTWFDWGSTLKQRYNLEPSTCPLVSVVPADLDTERRQDTNVLDMFPQMVEVGVATSGQDARPCEKMVARCVSVVQAADHDCLGLAQDGLNSVRLASGAWSAEPREEGAKIVWLAALTVRLAWRL